VGERRGAGEVKGRLVGRGDGKEVDYSAAFYFVSSFAQPLIVVISSSAAHSVALDICTRPHLSATRVTSIRYVLNPATLCYFYH
jgi:hypothetical protein